MGGKTFAAAREDAIRARDRTLVRAARANGKRWLLAVLLIGPGVITMLGENDGPSMLSYAATGAVYGLGFFVPFIVLTFAMAYAVQETVTRIAIATQRGHGELIFSRFGAPWGYVSLADLLAGNVLTLVAEFAAICSGAAFFGVPRSTAVLASLAIVLAGFATRRYFTWERFVMVLAAGNLVFVPIALHAHPHAAWPAAPALNLTFVTLLVANVGATVTPWMIFFQQSAVGDKGLTPADLRHARFDTALGAALAAAVAVATVAIGAVLFERHAAAHSLTDTANFAAALAPFIGRHASALFALGMMEAGLTAAMAISASSGYTAGQSLERSASLNRGLRDGALFYAVVAASLLMAAAIVLDPRAPLLTLALIANVVAAGLMIPALVFVLVLANDRRLMGPLANGPAANVAGAAVTLVVGSLSAAYLAFLL